MARIKIKDIPKNTKIDKQVMKKLMGGVIGPDDFPSYYRPYRPKKRTYRVGVIGPDD